MARIGLVLGAGGVVGHAFHAGGLKALEEATGWDPRKADVIVGTSAGSQVAALLRAGLAARDLYARSVGEPPSPEGARIMEAIGPPRSPPGRRARFSPGAFASPRFLLRAATRPWTVRPGTITAALMPAGRIPTDMLSGHLRTLFADRWPSLAMWVCAVRLDDGRRVVFGREGAPSTSVADAVAASCAIPGFFEPVDIGGIRYVDGGAWSVTNLDALAGAGLDLVVVSAPMSMRGGLESLAFDVPARAAVRLRLAQEAGRVRRAGAEIVAFQPGADVRESMGDWTDALDPSRRAPVAREAYASALRHLERPETRKRLTPLRDA